MKKESGTLEKVLNFLEDRGFYIILFLCVLSIGISGYVLFFSEDDPGVPGDSSVYFGAGGSEFAGNSDYGLPVIRQEPITIDNDPPRDPLTEPNAPGNPSTDPGGAIGTIGDAPAPNLEINDPIKEDQPAMKVQIPEVTDPPKPQYARPVDGPILQSFSGDDMVFSQTMSDWRVHGGTDFNVRPGEQVRAVMAGTIADVYTDEVMGVCVLINHADDLQTLYTGLMNDPSVSPGDTVDAGDIIGGAGDTSLLETAEGIRLHVELYKNGERTDLEQILHKAA